jgi:hypothetical protein
MSASLVERHIVAMGGGGFSVSELAHAIRG